MNVSKIDSIPIAKPPALGLKSAPEDTGNFHQTLKEVSNTALPRHDSVTLSPAATGLAEKQREIERVRAQGQELGECGISRAELATSQVPKWMMGFANVIVEVVGSQTFETRLTPNATDDQMKEFSERLQVKQQAVLEAHGLWGLDALDEYVVMNTTPGLEALLHQDMNDVIRADSRLMQLIKEIGFYMTDVELSEV